MCVKGRPLTAEHRAKLSAAKKGRAIPPEQRAKMIAGIRRVKAAKRNGVSKVCPRCKAEKPLDAFGVLRASVDGRGTYCRECRHEQSASRREKESESRRRWRDANRETLQAKKRAWYVANRERLAERARERYLANREAKKAATRAYAKANPAVHTASTQRRRARKRLAALAPVSVEGLGLKWDFWGGRCWMCGEAADTWDHVKPLSKGGAHCLANLRPACRSCNCSKRAKWPFALAA